MSYAKRMSQLPTSRRQHLAALALVAALAFSLGVATAPLGRRIAWLTGSVAPPRPAAVVVPGANNSPPAAVGRAPALVRVPYEVGWELYDDGWAGGPGQPSGTRRAPALERVPYEAGWELYDHGWAGGPRPTTGTRRAPALERVPYEAGWELYDGGWAGGPAPASVTNRRSTLVRVPYEEGWELYDGGWAGGPNTLPRRTSGQ